MNPLAKFLNRILPDVTVSDPSRESLAVPYSAGSPLTPHNAFSALGAPQIQEVGATGTFGGPSTRTLEKRAIVYKDVIPSGYRNVGGGFTFNGFDAPPIGFLHNSQQA